MRPALLRRARQRQAVIIQVGETTLSSNQSIQRAIWAILGTTTAAAGFAPRVMAADATAAPSSGLEEIVVTAQRRNENIQNVPITIQAVSGDQLKALNVTTMNDLLKYTPNVSFSGNGAPGTGNIFMRGLSSGGSGNQSQSTTAPFPNVALYLDDQSMQFPARNNDVYMVDLERVEVLEGPQGTLFGGGSQAGAVRYITNKPKLNETSSYFNAGYGVTAGGDPNSNMNATFNLPLIAGKLAVRATIFSDSRGGYISNVGGTISVPPQTLTGVGEPPVRPGSGEVGNVGVQGINLNTANKQGIRLAALLQISDDWDLLLQQNYQNSAAHGYWSTEPVGPNGQNLSPYQTMNFAPAYSKDRYTSTAWTVNGKLGDLLKVVYTGSYLSRHIDGQEDYSNYLRSFHGSYYACSGQGAGYSYFRSTKPTSCYPPVGSWRDQVRNTHDSHELRISTPDDKRFRALVGAFHENFTIYDNMNFNYMGMPQCTPANLAIALAPWNLDPTLGPIVPPGPDCVAAPGPMPGFFANDPSLRENAGTAFGEDVRRGYKQTAFFGSFDFDLIPKVLTATVGARHYKYDEFEEGSEYYSASSSVLNVPNGSVRQGFGINLAKSESGTKYRGNITWHITPDVLAYVTYSEGFRPGGFNRTKTNIDGSVISLKAVAPYYADGTGKQLNKPVGYDSDNLTNKEVGIKSQWFNHRLQVNVSGYIMDWTGVQLPLFDPTHLGNTTFDINGPTYQVKGVELQFVARLTQGLTVQGSSSWNSSNQTDAPCLQSNRVAADNPTPIGQCITQIKGQPYTNPYGVLDTAPAYSPALQFNVRARYDFTAGEYKAFWSLGMNHTAHYRNEPESFPNGDAANAAYTTTLLKYNIPGYDTYDGAIGVAKEAWTVQLTANNLGNSDAATSISSGQFIKQVVPLRPRVMTLEFGYKF
jgi:iron complex outermembrane recepter protein